MSGFPDVNCLFLYAWRKSITLSPAMQAHNLILHGYILKSEIRLQPMITVRKRGLPSEDPLRSSNPPSSSQSLSIRIPLRQSDYDCDYDPSPRHHYPNHHPNRCLLGPRLFDRFCPRLVGRNGDEYDEPYGTGYGNQSVYCFLALPPFDRIMIAPVDDGNREECGFGHAQ